MLGILLAQYPIVLIHGFSSSAYYMSQMKSIISREMPDAPVINCEIGNGYWTSIFMDVSKQVNLLAQCIIDHNVSESGYIGVGHSQGAYLMRTLLEEHNHKMSPMIRLISLSGPQGGFFCGVKSKCKGQYLSWFQKKIVFWLEYSRLGQYAVVASQYWRNPYKLQSYAKYAKSLPLVDNIRDFDNQRKTNFMSVDKIVLFGGPTDEVISPWQSAFFGTWKDGTDAEVDLYNEREEYKQDTFGLKSMVEQNRVFFEETDLHHGDYITDENFIVTRLVPYLKTN
ncbi:Palmitoyl-protein thioesterase [Spironucleus salmonicida]|nr:Palmitoyl-protein thioesterase [Spironucleus salmonicida]